MRFLKVARMNALATRLPINNHTKHSLQTQYPLDALVVNDFLSQVVSSELVIVVMLVEK